ncbi:hypothetical protein B0H67DRAFT_639405 [Lasiosphaeris hirsuta]|uniref:Uncharacterized protein n=1 Tax=Lasiosphaeris hirsuta TaxID=260670 RepID=A0AA40BB74_9PEZI|nr:hypothetical protein B0H67DRAFT_639405 [Lasiosphaeris hirsuta]
MYNDMPFEVLYFNGPPVGQECAKRHKQPRPRLPEAQRVQDDTDYMVRDGKFYPGAMISSTHQGEIPCSATSGILVQERGTGERRLTCSWHVWEKLAAANPHILPSDESEEAQKLFKVYHGATMSPVATVVARIGNTDIALGRLDDGIQFENESMGTNIRPRLRSHHKNMQYTDRVELNSFTAGRQVLMVMGSRLEVRRTPGPAHSTIRAPPNTDHLLPTQGVPYIHLHQGVYATVDEVLEERPFIRDSACGAVLVRYSDGKVGPRTVLQRGEVCGMMRSADITHSKCSVNGYLAYADSFAPLIEEGWTAVPPLGEETMENIPAPVEEPEGPVDQG